ncbi:hypothetical protein F2Q69_00023595 [Brassica cretica]|uniref:Uncharacterized protein n=1 Tax=Brassica cretica TaxID=69181 RepID=A0A8S9PZ55_BRACR|nr:hypothetical protein F2Q69_00023596 [Brassica cretica]KAF3535652.1 hypothetical protein F2Q69_00023595 [Brassica cretica]
MGGSPYRKFSIFWKGAQFQGPNSRFLLAGTWSVPLSETRGSGSCLEAGGNDTGIFFPNNIDGYTCSNVDRLFYWNIDRRSWSSVNAWIEYAH